MARSVSYDRLLKTRLKDPREAAAYLNAVLEERDHDLFMKALRKVAEAQGGMTRLAARAKVSRVGLYKALAEKGNPGIRTVGNILSAFRLRLSVQSDRSATVHA